MCAQFDLKILADELSLKYGIQVPQDFNFDHRVMPHAKAPVLTKDGFKMMKFSLLPSWSRESKIKFATHNSRIETIEEKATWRGPFKKNHCLVPISRFIEPIYKDDFKGFMVAFSDTKSEIMTAVGIYDSWVNKETGEVIDSFAIVTTEPPEFIKKIGHDRCPLFLKESAFSTWLKVNDSESEQTKEFLLKNQKQLEFRVVKDREMRPGWEKRI